MEIYRIHCSQSHFYKGNSQKEYGHCQQKIKICKSFLLKFLGTSTDCYTALKQIYLNEKNSNDYWRDQIKPLALLQSCSLYIKKDFTNNTFFQVIFTWFYSQQICMCVSVNHIVLKIYSSDTFCFVLCMAFRSFYKMQCFIPGIKWCSPHDMQVYRVHPLYFYNALSIAKWDVVMTCNPILEKLQCMVWSVLTIANKFYERMSLRYVQISLKSTLICNAMMS